MKKLCLLTLFAVGLQLSSIQAQEIAEINLSPDGKSMFIDFDCRTMSHAPLQRLMVCNEGQLEGLSLMLNRELLNIDAEGIPLSSIPHYLRVAYTESGQLKKIVDKNSRLSMKFFYENGFLTKVIERSSKSNLSISYNRDQMICAVSDRRHHLKIQFDYQEGQLSKVKGCSNSSTHNFVYRNAQLQKIKQRGQGTLVAFDYKNGYIHRMKDQDNPIPLRIANRWW